MVGAGPVDFDVVIVATDDLLTAVVDVTGDGFDVVVVSTSAGAVTADCSAGLRTITVPSTSAPGIVVDDLKSPLTGIESGEEDVLLEALIPTPTARSISGTTTAALRP